jgi:DNA-binding YbaB/EbfC family protein
MSKDLAKLVKEAQKLEKRFAEAREALRDLTVQGTAGGGVVKVTMNGQHDVLSVSVAPEVLEGGDVAMLEDLLLAALREAKERSDELAARELAKVTGGAPGPGGFSVPR